MSEKRVLVTGASGLLGGNLVTLLPESWKIVGVVNAHPINPGRKNVSIISADLIQEDIDALLESNKPIDAVIHTAALTNVELCEEKKRLTWDLNAALAQRIAAACKKHGIRLIHISTDHVFDGREGNYNERSKPHAINYYAETKLAAEELIQDSGCDYTIIRTNFFGYYIQDKRGIAGWILDTLRENEPLPLFTDVRFSPILTNLIVPYIAEVVEKNTTGILHIASSNSCSKYEFGMKVANAFGVETSNIVSSALESSDLWAPRPRDMSLNTEVAENLLSTKFPTVDESIAQYKRLADEDYPQFLQKMAAH